MKAENYPMAYTEVYEILKYIEPEYIDKIPKEFIELVNKKRDINYKYELDLTKDFQKQELLKETKGILAYMYINYWSTPEEKAKIKEKFKYDIEKNEKAKERKYKIDVFENAQDDIEHKEDTVKEDSDIEEELQLIEYKQENFITKIINKIKQFFKRGFNK